MAFMDIINKGVSMAKDGANNIKNSVNEKKGAIEAFEALKNQSEPYILTNPYVVNNDDPQPGKEELIMTMCLTINKDKASIINNIIPKSETIVDIVSGKEAKTDMECLFVLTNARLWILNESNYNVYSLEALPHMQIVNKSMMSQGVNFENRAFIIDGNEKVVTDFIDVLSNAESRKILTEEKLSYLCGITPHIQLLNRKLRGITIDASNNLVLHNHTTNTLVNPKDINRVEVLVNDIVAYIKGREASQGMTNFPKEARNIKVKVLTATTYYVIEVLPDSSMGTAYKAEDSTYIDNYEFAKKIVDNIYELIREC